MTVLFLSILTTILGVASSVAIAIMFAAKKVWNIKRIVLCAVLCITAGIGIYNTIEEAGYRITGESTGERVEKYSYELVNIQEVQKEYTEYYIFSTKKEKQYIPEYRIYYKEKNGDIKFCENSVKEISLAYTKENPRYEVVETRKTQKGKWMGLIPYEYISSGVSSEQRLYIAEIPTDFQLNK